MIYTNRILYYMVSRAEARPHSSASSSPHSLALRMIWYELVRKQHVHTLVLLSSCTFDHARRHAAHTHISTPWTEDDINRSVHSSNHIACLHSYVCMHRYNTCLHTLVLTLHTYSTRIYTHTRASTHMFIDIYIHTHTHTHTCTLTCTRTCARVHTRTQVHAHTRTITRAYPQSHALSTPTPLLYTQLATAAPRLVSYLVSYLRDLSTSGIMCRVASLMILARSKVYDLCHDLSQAYAIYCVIP